MKPRLHRLSLDISKQHRKQLGELCRLLDDISITEATRRSCALMAILVRHRRAGGKVLLRALDGTEENLLIL